MDLRVSIALLINLFNPILNNPSLLLASNKASIALTSPNSSKAMAAFFLISPSLSLKQLVRQGNTLTSSNLQRLCIQATPTSTLGSLVFSSKIGIPIRSFNLPRVIAADFLTTGDGSYVRAFIKAFVTL